MLPLNGLKVLELGIWVAGPTCGVILADCGADVVKVEHLASGGDPIRGWRPPNSSGEDQPEYLFEAVNRGKRSLAIDLKQEQGLEIMCQLVKEADVFITNLRLPTLESLKIDYDTFHSLNPRLIYGRASGYGPRGPDRGRAGFDSIGFWARSGLMAAHGEPEGPPVPMRASIGDMTTGTFLFAGIMLALYQRMQSDQGALVDGSLLATGAWVASEILWLPLATGAALPKNSRNHPPNPLHNSYRCSDDRWVQLCILQTDRYWQPFCEALDIQDAAADPRFNTHALREENSGALVDILTRVFGARTLREWAERLDRHDLAWGPVSTGDEVVEDPQVKANDYVVDVTHPIYGQIREMAIPFQLDGVPLGPKSAGPQFGQSNEEILLDLGYAWEDIAALKDKKVVL